MSEPEHNQSVPKEAEEIGLSCPWRFALIMWWAQTWRATLFILPCVFVVRIFQIDRLIPPDVLMYLIAFAAVIWSIKRSLEVLRAASLTEDHYVEITCPWRIALLVCWAQIWRSMLIGLPIVILLVLSHTSQELQQGIGWVVMIPSTVWATKKSLEIFAPTSAVSSSVEVLPWQSIWNPQRVGLTSFNPPKLSDMSSPQGRKAAYTKLGLLFVVTLLIVCAAWLTYVLTCNRSFSTSTLNIPELQTAADLGNVKAQYALGEMYHYGLKSAAVAVNDTEALKWWSEAAEQGHAKAQVRLGIAYATGHGVAKDYEQAVSWFLKSAAQGNAEAQACLGLAYYNGQGVPKDITKSVQWFRKAADQGFAPAQTSLGVAYHTGEGVPEDMVQSYMWTSLAAAQSYKPATDYLALLKETMVPEQITEANHRAAQWKPTPETTPYQ